MDLDVDTGVGSVAAEVGLDASGEEVVRADGGTGDGTGVGFAKRICVVFSSTTEMRRIAKRQTD